MQSPIGVTSTGFSVRPLAMGDIEQLQLSESSEEFFKRAVHRQDWSDRGLRVFVGELTEEPTEVKTLIGYVFIGLGYPPYFPAVNEGIGQLYLANIQVEERYRCRGFGSQLLEFVKQMAQQLNLDVIRAECAKGWLISFYERIGFQPVDYRGPVDNYPDSHQMLELWLIPPSSISSSSS